MNVSKLTIGKDTARYGERRLDILKYLQDEQAKNPRFLRNTSLKQIAKCYAMYTGTNSGTAQATMSKMVKNNMIIVHRLKSGRDARANYRINYLYPNLPQEFVSKASPEDKKYIEDVYSRLKSKQDAGENCILDGANDVIVTKATPAPAPAPVPVPVEEPKVIPITAPVEVDRRGSNISITINLNLNGLS